MYSLVLLPVTLVAKGFRTHATHKGLKNIISKYIIFSYYLFFYDWIYSVVDRRRYDANYSDPDPYFHFDADPEPDPDWHQNGADPHSDPPPSLYMLKKQEEKYLHLFTAMPVYNVFPFS
jgi:hypothetical protein